jgi:glycosyltransferase involved in cell wall biosynthesis
MTPSVSVAIPAFRAADLLPRAIRSAYGQTVPVSQVVVIDDGSPDDTAGVLGRLAAELPASFEWHTQANKGEAAARNACLAHVTGDYVAFIDHDDVWAADKLARQIEAMDRTGADLVFTAYRRVGPDGPGEEVHLGDWSPRREDVLARLFVGCCITPSTVLVRREVFDDLGGFDESLPLGCDWDMWLRITASGRRIEYLDEVLVEYAWHGANMSADRRRTGAAALTLFGRFFDGPEAEGVTHLRRPTLARWHLNYAEYLLDAGDRAEARRHLVAAVKVRPRSIRLGWLRLALRSARP